MTEAEKNTSEDKEETLAERSARLEAEAATAAEHDALFDSADPLAPEPHPEDLDAPSSSEDTAKIEALQNELNAAKEQMMRALADAENTRRRSQKEREDAGKYAVSGFAKDLLEVSDNLRRALEAVPDDLLDAEPRLKNLVDGIEATERTMLKAFEKNGVKKIEPMDEPFDPNFHEVMFEQPMPGKPAGTIIQVMEPGYTLHDRLIRPARVGITKDDGSAPPQGDSHPGDHIDTEA